MKSFSARFFLTVILLLSEMAFPVQAQERNALPEAVRQVLDQALAAREANDAARELALLEQGIQAIGPEDPSVFAIYQRIGEYHADRGSSFQAMRANERQLKLVRLPGQELMVRVRLVSLYSSLYQMDKAKAEMQALQTLMPRLRGASGWQKFGNVWQMGVAWAGANYQTRGGHLSEGEAGWRSCLTFSEAVLAENPDHPAAQFYLVDCTSGLLGVLLASGKLAEAGAVVAQQRLEIERIARALKRPALLSRVALPFGRVALEQGRIGEARSIFQKAIDEIGAMGSANASQRIAALRLHMAMAEMLEGHWEKAERWHEERAEALKRAGGERGNIGLNTPEHAYTLVRLGRAEAALEQMNRVIKGRQTLFDENSLMTWEGHAFHGVALAASGQREAALKELRVAIPKVLELANGERSAADGGLLRSERLGWMLDEYLMLLGEIAADPAKPERQFAIEEAFRLADVARGSTVQRALAQAASRATITDPGLADLAGREQEMQREISQLSEAIGNLLSRGRLAEQDAALTEMRKSLQGLRKQHADLARDLASRYPNYASLIDPKPVALSSVQKMLKPGEALVSIYSGSSKTLVWAVSRDQPTAFAVAKINAEQAADNVRTLRRALDPNAVSDNSLPVFDAALAHQLYSQLLTPVESAWRGSRELIVVPHGRLGQLPFAVLMTEPWKPARQPLLYAELAAAPWLLNRTAISQMPSVVSFAAMRSGKLPEPAQRPFLGVGDPLFVVTKAPTASTTRGIVRRNLSLKSAAVNGEGSINFNLLPQLPDTAIELNEIGAVLGAETGRDILLQEKASESSLKQADLAAYRVLMFATHGLMSGEMPGLYQPALALSNPKLTGEGEDGMLTMEEILGLKLRADWVVLSACNTAASDGNLGGAESFSGLGRAFFFAGARALLATSWAVETESARMLTTDIFRRQLANPGMTRAVALQQASQSLMKQSAGNEYSYAHPMFWAPYVLVGDGS